MTGLTFSAKSDLEVNAPDDEAGGEEEVERRCDLRDTGHDDAEQAKLAALE
jgi:hypothetical protein